MAHGWLNLSVLSAALGAACHHDWAELEPVPLDECTLPALPDPRTKVVYVAQEGDDGADGARNRPVKTLARAVALLGGAGGSIVMKEGDYPSQESRQPVMGSTTQKTRSRTLGKRSSTHVLVCPGRG